MNQPATVTRHLRHAGLLGVFSVAGALACSGDGVEPAPPRPSDATSGGAGGISGSSAAGAPSSSGGSPMGGTGSVAGSPAGGSGSGGGASGGSASGGSGAATPGGSAGAGGNGGGGQSTGGSGGTSPMGMCPMALPPLAADNDTSFYANRDGIPHGAIEQVQYKAGVSKTMHVYTPPDYDTNTAAAA